MFFCQVKSLEAEVKKVKEHEEFYQNKVGMSTCYPFSGANIFLANNDLSTCYPFSGANIFRQRSGRIDALSMSELSSATRYFPR